MERTLTGARVGFTGEVDGCERHRHARRQRRRSTGSSSASAATSRSRRASGRSRASRCAVGPNRLTGDVAKDGGAPATGTLALDAPDIAAARGARARRGDGRGRRRHRPRRRRGRPGRRRCRRQARDVAVGATRVGALDVEAQVERRARAAAGRRHPRRAATSSSPASRSPRSARRRRRSTRRRCSVEAESRLAIGTLADLSGELKRLDDGFAARLDTLRLRQQGVAATLTAPATVTVSGGAVDLTPLGLDFGTRQPDGAGRGSARAFDIDVDDRDHAARARQRDPARPRSSPAP